MSGCLKLSDNGGDLGATIAALNYVGCVVMDEPSAVVGPLPIPAGIELRFCPGGTLTLDDVLTVHGSIEAGAFQIFDLQGGSVVTGDPGRTTEVRPEWWGAQGDLPAGALRAAGTDDTAAIQAAIEFFAKPGGLGGGRVQFRPLHYRCDGQITLRDGVWILGQRGQGSNVVGGTTLVYTGPKAPTGGPLTDMSNVVDDLYDNAFVRARGPSGVYINCRIEDIGIGGHAEADDGADIGQVTVDLTPSAANTKVTCETPLLDALPVGLFLERCSADLRNVTVSGFRDRCIYYRRGIQSRFERVRAFHARRLIEVSEVTTTTVFTTCGLEGGTRQALAVIGGNQSVRIGGSTFIEHCWGDGIYADGV